MKLIQLLKITVFQNFLEFLEVNALTKVPMF